MTLYSLRDHVAETEGACYESEFTCWTRTSGKSRKQK
jgi:hypothetical protein